MKRMIVSSVPIFGMAYERKKIIQRLEGFSKVILEHVAKCVMYGSSFHSYNHWISDEIATWIVDASDMYLDKHKKLKARDYADHLFGEFGTEIQDARTNLHIQQNADKRADPPYPAVIVDKDMISNMFEACTEIRDTFSSLLSETAPLEKADVELKLHEILDKHCRKEDEINE